VSGTTMLMLTCVAQSTVRGQLRTETAQEIYSLKLPKNMDRVCGGELFCGNSLSPVDIHRFVGRQNIVGRHWRHVKHFVIFFKAGE